MLEQLIKDGVGVKVDVRIDIPTALILAAAIFVALLAALSLYAKLK